MVDVREKGTNNGSMDQEILEGGVLQVALGVKVTGIRNGSIVELDKRSDGGKAKRPSKIKILFMEVDAAEELFQFRGKGVIGPVRVLVKQVV